MWPAWERSVYRSLVEKSEEMVPLEMRRSIFTEDKIRLEDSYCIFLCILCIVMLVDGLRTGRNMQHTCKGNQLN